jgi:hypothetical protein
VRQSREVRAEQANEPIEIFIEPKHEVASLWLTIRSISRGRVTGNEIELPYRGRRRGEREGDRVSIVERETRILYSLVLTYTVPSLPMQ